MGDGRVLGDLPSARAIRSARVLKASAPPTIYQLAVVDAAVVSLLSIIGRIPAARCRAEVSGHTTARAPTAQ